MLRTIKSEQLRAGMYVQKLCGPWVEHPFWRSKFLAGQAEVERIHASRVAEVVIDTVRGLDIDDRTAGKDAASSDTGDADCAPAGQTPEVPNGRTDASEQIQVGMGAELANARRILEQGRGTVETMFQHVRLGRAVDTEQAMPLVEAISDSVLRNPQALISVARLKTADNYTYLHSMAVAAMMSALARQLGLDQAQTLEAAMGGLLHDMGKAATPPEILNKPGKLTDAEFEVMRQHSIHGYQLLAEGGVENAAVLDIALHHHEKIDGSGYPHRLAGDDITLMARMGAICDVYDAVSSDRPYKRGWCPAESLKQMASWQGHFDPAIFKIFVRCLGIYPVGSMVQLASQKLAVVTEQNAGLLLKPRVRAFYGMRQRSHMLVQDIDLAHPDCQDRIVQLESPATWGFRDLDRLWMS